MFTVSNSPMALTQNVDELRYWSLDAPIDPLTATAQRAVGNRHERRVQAAQQRRRQLPGRRRR